jgi:uncharacterized protein (DUF1501 family)
VDTWTRRKFLTMSGVTAATALAAGATLYSIDDLLNSGSEDGDSESSVLVLVTLYGGNDGLNTLVPAWDKAYQDARPDLAYSEEEVLPLDEELGLNPGMKGFKKLWDEKRLAVVRGVSYPRPDRSHFRSMSIWQTGSPSHPLPSGWLGRWLDAAENPDPLRAVSIGATLPPLLAGEKTAGAAVQLGGLTLPDPWRVVCKELAQPQDGVHPLQARAAASLSDLTKVAAEFGTEGGKSKDGKYGKNGGKGKGGKNKDGEGKGEESQSPEDPTEARDGDGDDGATAGGQGQLGAQLDIVAKAIAAGAPTRAYSVSLGGFDTHANEKNTQSRLLGQLDGDISAFLEKIRATKARKRVVVAVYSEFGRRVKANANQGTDHGTAGPLFIAGESVKGGFYGEQPSLSKLKDDDLQMTTDFRDVYATLLERVLDTDPGKILDGHDRTLDFV